MSRWLAVTTFSLLFSLATPALAQEGAVVIGLGASYAGERFDDGGLDVDDSRSWTAQAGYAFNEFLTVEVEYEQLDDFDLGQDIDLGIATLDIDGDLSGWIGSVNAKIFPFGGARLRPYVMGGVGYMDVELDFDVTANAFGQVGTGSASEDENAAVLQLGLGLDLQLTDRWFVELEGAYKFPQSDLDDFRFFTIGGTVQYRF